MKKLISAFAAAVFTAALAASQLFGFCVSASEYSASGFTLTYTSSSSGVVITGCSGSGSSLEIPEDIGGVAVTSIAAKAFSEITTLTDVTIPDSVTSIGESAFWNCTALRSAVLGSGVSEIGDYAFSACPRLGSFSVSTSNSTYTALNGMLYSKDQTVLVCYAGGVSAEIPQNTITVGKGAFFGNSTLSSVSLPSGLTKIGDYAFSGCFSLSRASIPMTVISLGKGSFMNCSSMNQVTLGSGVTEIPEDCFSGCTSLELLYIPPSIRTIGSSAFFGCNKLSGIHIPETVTNISNAAVGMHYNIRSGKTEAVRGFFISGVTGSAAEKYARSSRVDFLDFDNIPYGDTDGSGYVDAVDASLVIAEYARIATSKNQEFTFYQTTVSDFNTDGIIDAVDASLILAEYAANAVS